MILPPASTEMMLLADELKVSPGSNVISTALLVRVEVAAVYFGLLHIPDQKAYLATERQCCLPSHNWRSDSPSRPGSSQQPPTG